MDAPKRALIVEDDPSIRELLADLLAGEGYLVSQAADGIDGLREFSHERPDVILLDLMMPDMDGRAFARACYLRAAARPVPTLLMSAGPELAQAATQLRSFGVRAAMAKPFDVNLLIQTVDRLAEPAALLAVAS